MRLSLEAGAITAWSGYAAWWYAVCMFLYFIDYMTTLSALLDHPVSRVDCLPFWLSDQNWSSSLRRAALLVFPGSVGTKTSRAVSGELPIWFLFGLGSLCRSNNSSPVVSSGESNLPKSGTLEPRAPTQGTAVQFLDEWSRGPSFRAGTPSILYH